MVGKVRPRALDYLMSIGLTHQVFLVLWAEPAGAGATRITNLPMVIPGKHKEQVYSKVRRFVVVRAGDQSCSAL